ncbi:MAG: hypothetical protein KKD86_00250 [Bacteroidetes bacterium]|nr:hypothetical protein [Bacteroidota bacterium]
MNLSNRVFAVLEGEEIVRIGSNQFMKLHRFDEGVSYEKFRNKKIKIALYLIELRNRKPFCVVQEWYNYYEFDEEGRFDQDKYYDQINLKLSSVNLWEDDEKMPEKVIDGKIEFYKRRLENDYEWYPTKEMKNRLLEKLFR